MAEINAAVEELLKDEIRRGNLELNASAATAAYLLTHFLFSIGRDADPDFNEIWTCMNFKDKNARVHRGPSRERNKRRDPV
jgi:hypothetical protein